MTEPEFRMIETNGVTLHTALAGDGPLVILLHGWPQCWYLWRHQIAPLAAAGYRVAVPDQRGYGASSKPDDVRAYNIRELAADVAGLAHALGYDDFVLFGHDWGCLVAWNTALLHADGATMCLGDNGHLLWLELAPEGATVISRVSLFRANESWTPPVLSRGLLYVRQTTRERFGAAPARPRLMCYDLRAGGP